MGTKAKAAGLQFAYHNHNFEFKPLAGGKIGYDIILSETDPSLVKFELDCGWMAAAGHDPVEYLTKYPKRYRLLHIKDFHPTEKPSVGLEESERPKAAELGRGHVDYKPIFAAAAKTEVELYYVERNRPSSPRRRWKRSRSTTTTFTQWRKKQNILNASTKTHRPKKTVVTTCRGGRCNLKHLAPAKNLA